MDCFILLVMEFFCFYLSCGTLRRLKSCFSLKRQPLNEKLFLFRIVFQHCLRSTLRFMFLSDEGPTLETLDFTSISAVHQPFYISICISTLPTQDTTFYVVIHQPCHFDFNLANNKGKFW